MNRQLSITIPVWEAEQIAQMCHQAYHTDNASDVFAGPSPTWRTCDRGICQRVRSLLVEFVDTVEAQDGRVATPDEVAEIERLDGQTALWRRTEANRWAGFAPDYAMPQEIADAVMNARIDDAPPEISTLPKWCHGMTDRDRLEVTRFLAFMRVGGGELAPTHPGVTDDAAAVAKARANVEARRAALFHPRNDPMYDAHAARADLDALRDVPVLAEDDTR